MEHRLIFKGLPRVDIGLLDGKTVGDITRETRLNATMTITNAHGSSFSTGNLYDGNITIKGRGNSSWQAAKKPFAIVLTDSAFKKQAAVLLEMPADHDWCLLSEPYDASSLMNSVGFRLGWAFGMEWAPRSQKVVLYVNGAFHGLYNLCEKIKVAPERIDITKLKVTDTAVPEITGGYVFERDNYAPGPDEPHFTDTVYNAPYTIKEPSDCTQEQSDWLRDDFSAAINALNTVPFTDLVNGYRAFFDIPAFISQFLLQDLVKNADAALGSYYYYKDREGKYKAGPGWDFDVAYGSRVFAPWTGLNVAFNDPNDTYVAKIDKHIAKMMEDVWFKNQVATIFKQQLPLVHQVLADADTYVQALKATGVPDLDAAKWGAGDLIATATYILGFVRKRLYYHTRAIYDPIPPKPVTYVRSA